MAKKQTAAVAVAHFKAPAPPSPAPSPVQSGQTVYVSVISKTDIAGNGFDASPKVFATREAAQVDCDNLNATRMNPVFVVREMRVN